MDEINALTETILGCALKVHKTLGPGLLENAYKECLYYELVKNGIKVEKEKSMPLIYDNMQLECGYRVDLMVDNKVIIELKAVEELLDVHLAQTLTYLKLNKSRVGLLINFNVVRLKDGIKRVINGY